MGLKFYLELYHSDTTSNKKNSIKQLQCAEPKYGIIFKTFYFSQISLVFETKNMMNLNFHD